VLKLKLSYITELESTLGPIATQIRADLAAVGINIELDPIPQSQFGDRALVKRDLPFALNDNEKPIAVDAPGVRAVLETCKKAKQKNLCIVSGLCLRYHNGFIEAAKRIHAGDIGELHTLQANDYRGGIWLRPRQPEWTDMHWQMRNWYYFTWLSGDFNVEQHIHFLDVCIWMMKNEYPVKAIGMGGRTVRTGPEYGNIYDHHSVIYEFANGARLYSNTRQMPDCSTDLSVQVVGDGGRAHLSERKKGVYLKQNNRGVPQRTYDGVENDF
jgi:predicted dehydrogenase